MDLNEKEAVLHAGGETPVTRERKYDAAFAVVVWDRALDELKKGYCDSQGADILDFSSMLSLLVEDEHGSIGKKAKELGVPAVTLRGKLCRFRKRLRARFKSEVAEIAEPHLVEEESRYLLECLSCRDLHE